VAQPLQEMHGLPLALSADGRMLACLTEDIVEDRRGNGPNQCHQTVSVWDLISGKKLHQAGPELCLVRSAAFIGKELWIASQAGHYDGPVQLWEISKATKPFAIKGTNLLCGFAFDGKRLAIGGLSGLVAWHDVATGKQLGKVKAPEQGHKYAVSFWPKSNILIAAGMSAYVQFWDLSTGNELPKTEGHHDRVHSVGILADGKTIVSGAHDRTMRLWDRVSGQQLQCVKGGVVSSLAVSADGKTVVGGGDYLHLWNGAGKEIGRLSGPEDSWY